MRLLAWIALFCAGTGMGLAEAADRGVPAPPWWAKELPEAARAGGRSGAACVALPLPKGQWLTPAHCAAGFDPSQPGKDYAWVEGEPSRGWVLAPNFIATRRHVAGESVWVQRAGSWTRARISASSGSSYWIEGAAEDFCPGDSGSAVWVGEGGEPKWLAMVVSGDALTGCSAKAAAVAASAIVWPWLR